MIAVRPAVETDFTAIAAIYGHHVLTGTGTFATEPPSEAEMRHKFHALNTLRLPYLVAVDGETVVGFAYAAPFRERAGYKYGVEDSLYLAPGCERQGIGKALLLHLIGLCTQRGLYTMLAVIGDHDNVASMGLHRACGFRQTGTLPRAGYKFDRWLDVVLMMRDLLPPTDAPEGQGWAG